MGISHGFRLVHAARLALAMAMPLVTVWTTLAALVGGMLAADLALGITPRFFLSGAAGGGAGVNLTLAVGKSVVFGVLIALVGCHYGLRVKPNTESLGAGHHGLGGDLDHGGDSGGRAVCGGVQGRGHMTATAAPASPEAPCAVRDRASCGRCFARAGREAVVHQDLNLTIERGRAAVASWAARAAARRCCCARCWAWKRRRAARVTVLGRPAAQLGERGAASRVGMLFQHGALFSAFSVLDNIAFPLRELGTLPDALVRDAALVKLQMVGLEPRQAPQDAGRPVGRHDQARGAGARADHGPAAAAAGRAHRRARPGQRRRLLRRCCVRCTASWA